MRKKQTINVVLHRPYGQSALSRIEGHMRVFYITQVEKQLNTSGLTKEQKLEVISLLAKDYHKKATNG